MTVEQLVNFSQTHVGATIHCLQIFAWTSFGVTDHAIKKLITRHIKFIQSIRRSPKFVVQLMLSKVMGNVNTITGKNIQRIYGVLGGKKTYLKRQKIGWKIKFDSAKLNRMLTGKSSLLEKYLISNIVFFTWTINKTTSLAPTSWKLLLILLAQANISF